MTEKRQRGRPKGTGKDDTAYLAKVADILVANEKLKPTTAMKQVMASKSWMESDSTLIRRWQEKWKATNHELMAAARQRMQHRTAAQTEQTGRRFHASDLVAIMARTKSPTQHAIDTLSTFTHQQRLMDQMIKVATVVRPDPIKEVMRRMMEIDEGPYMRVMRQMADIDRMTRPFGKKFS